MQDLNVLTSFEQEVLLAVFKDCREFFPSRALYDCDWKVAARVRLDDLYAEWKYVNTTLAAGHPIIPRLFPHWKVESLTTPRGVRAYRQLVGLFSRLERGVDPESALLAFKGRVSMTRSRLPRPYVPTAKALIASWLGAAPVLLELYPKHGPGAVAEGYKPLQKVHNSVYFRQLDAVGGPDLLYLNANHRMFEPRELKTFKHGITRVIAVPKDFSKPRIISAEPTTLMFLQQGVARYMMAVLEARCPYVNFRDQTVNAQLSRDYTRVATLDMSNASDTVSRSIVRQLFPKDWADLLFSLRSHYARLPDGACVPLRAFAPMGSALCFPVESIVFAACTVATLLHIDGGKWFSGEKRKLCRVYGDDIVVPIDAACAVVEVLRATGFEPNESKCCLTGLFRESCGAEWFSGDDVTIVRPRTLSPWDTRHNHAEITSVMPMALHATRLYNMGFSNAAQLLASSCKFPVAIGNGVSYVPSALTWPWPGKLRWNKGLQRLEQESTVVAMATAASYVGDCYAALFLGLTSNWSSMQVRTPRIKPKRAWVLASPLSER